MLKRFVVAVLSVSLLLTTVGCGDKSTSNEKETLTVEVYDRGFAYEDGMSVTDNRTTRFVNENFGAQNNVSVNYFSVPRAQEKEKINVLMASGDAPDIIFTYDRVTFLNYAKQGGLHVLDESVEKYGQNLKKQLGDNILQYGLYDGKLMAVTAKRMYSGQSLPYIRTDWLEKIGMNAPTNFDEFLTVLRAFRDQNPGDVQKERVSPYLLSASMLESPEVAIGIWPVVLPFVERMSAQDFYTLPVIKWPGFKEGVEMLNMMYNEGLIAEDFALKDNKAVEEDIANGRAGVFSGITSYFGSRVYKAMKSNNESAEITPLDCFKNAEGLSVKVADQAGGMYLMIPKTCKNPDLAVKYLDWMSQSENALTMYWGIEDVSYTVKDGIRSYIVDPNKKTLWNGNDMTITYLGGFYEDFDTYLKHIEFGSETHEWGVKNVETVHEGTKDSFTFPYFSSYIESQVNNMPNLNKKFQELMIKSIMAKPDEFSATFDKLSEEYMTIGGQRVMDDMIVEFEKMEQNGGVLVSENHPLIK